MYTNKNPIINDESPFNTNITTHQRIAFEFNRQDDGRWEARCDCLLKPDTTFLDCSHSFLGEIDANVLKRLFISENKQLTTLSLSNNMLFRKAAVLSAFSLQELTAIAKALSEPLKDYGLTSETQPQTVIELFLSLPDAAMEQLQSRIPDEMLSLMAQKLPGEEETLAALFSSIPESVLYLDLSYNALHKADHVVLIQAFQCLHKNLRVIELSGNGYDLLPDSVRLEIQSALPSGITLITNDDIPQRADTGDDILELLDDVITLSGSNPSTPSTPPSSPATVPQSFFPKLGGGSPREKVVGLGTSLPVAVSSDP